MKERLAFPIFSQGESCARARNLSRSVLKESELERCFVIIRRFVSVVRQREGLFCSSTFSLGQLFSLVLKKVLDRKAIRSYKCAIAFTTRESEKEEDDEFNVKDTNKQIIYPQARRRMAAVCHYAGLSVVRQWSQSFVLLSRRRSGTTSAGTGENHRQPDTHG